MTIKDLAPLTDTVEPENPSPDPLNVLARQLAEKHTLAARTSGHKLDLLAHPDKYETLLRQAYLHFTQAAEEELIISYAGEWLLDNFYIVQQAYLQAQEDMPTNYYRELPVLADSGYPRIYDLARTIIDFGTSRFTLEQVRDFVNTYQDTEPLMMGELWALPTMLRVGLLENLIYTVTELAGIKTELVPSNGLADDTVVANCIISLRLLAAQDWKTYFEGISRVDQILREDLVYGQMDFETRNRYRGVIEELAPNTGRDEERAAQMAVQLAKKAAQNRADSPFTDDRTVHVGYYLLDAGRPSLEKAIGYRPDIRTHLRRWVSNPPVILYLISIALIVGLLLLGIARYVMLIGGSTLQAVLICLLTLLTASDMAVNVINWLVSRFVPPRVLPKMDFSEGIPPLYRTMIVVPALLTDADEIDSLAQQLELHHLRNDDPLIAVALLADFADAPSEHMPDDETLTELATGRIQALNQKYGETQPFYFFLRRRQWNPGEDAWIGWERKRGKLMEFNCLLLNPACQTSFIVQIGDLNMLPEIRYVITLDADTVLPQGSAARLAATLAHPLNRAEFEPGGSDPVAGYTVLQPRVEIKPTTANRSLFAHIFSGDVGLDLYTLAVSDLYQDLFGEGIYVGKGIYDVAAFERSLAGRTRENTLLSHDLFEGLYGRAALVTDIVLLEDYPSHYLAHALRLHRWVRGDWQLLPWLMPRVPGPDGRTMPNRFSILDRWKITDNLRRSLTRPALIVLLIAGWLVFPGSAIGWTLIALTLSSGPYLVSLLNLLQAALHGAAGNVVAERFKTASYRWALSLAFLPYESLLIVDAILTTLWRLIRHKRLLQWTTAAHTARLLGSASASSLVWRQMFTSVLLSLGLPVVILAFAPVALIVALPLLVLWALSPQIANGISQPISYAPPPLSDNQRQQLRSLARRTWLFFEDFVGPEDHWLPPDHFQETPRGIIAHHTSPTNIGLYLLSTLAAYDLGYIGLLELALRFRSTFENIDQLERYRGHLLNWYDTRTLKPLLPRYVSTVDSGNLAGCLLALRQGFRDLHQTPVSRPERWQGVLDTLAILTEIMRDTQAKADIASMVARLEAITQHILAGQDDPIQRTALLAQLLERDWPDFTQSLMTFIESDSPPFEAARLNDLRIYSGRVRHHLGAMQRDMDLLLPWLPLFAKPPDLFLTDPAVREAWDALRTALPRVPLLGEVGDVYRAAQAEVDRLRERIAALDTQQAALDWCDQLTEALESARLAAQGLLIGFEDLERQAEALFQAMDFHFLFDQERCLFHIGYNLTSERLDNNYYDLLASESRIASLIAIAKDEIPASHWLYLGRPLSHVNGTQTLLSWSGSMFEYLMPTLLMQDYEGTLLSQSSQAVVHHHIAYGQQLGLPWGISESGYYAFDGNLNYQYRAFGVPHLAFKRGLAADMVIAPYASVLALPVQPQAVIQNMARYKQIDMLSTYGLYESIDYTPARLTLGKDQAAVREYMAHHQGMILLSLANYLYNNPMVRRFHADPRVQSVDLLLQERIPQQPTIQAPSPEQDTMARPEPLHATTTPWLIPADTPAPRVHFLSNGNYGVMITNAGSGYSQWRDTALTRWRSDVTLDDWGTWIYLLDRDSSMVWSAGYQPSGVVPEFHNVLFFAHKVEFQRRERDLSMNMEITIPPDDDLEIRRITLINHTDRPRHLLLSSYGEIVMAAQDTRHPAFNKMFIESEYLPDLNALLFRRRPRAANEPPFYMLHMLVMEPGHEPQITYETDRARFLGREQTPRTPAALAHFSGAFSGTVGATLDPIMALGQNIELEPYSSVQVVYLTIAAESRQDVIRLAENYRVWSMIQRGFDQARYQSERELRQLGLNTLELERVQRLLSGLFYPQPTLRAEPFRLAANTKSQPGLWAFGISGDYPILLVRVSDEADLELVRDVLQAHIYWRSRQLKVTLVILNQRDTGYTQELYNAVHRLIVRTGSELWINRHDGIFILRGDQMNDSDRALLAASARVYLDASRGGLANQIDQLPPPPVPLPAFVPTLSGPETPRDMSPLPRPTDLLFDNELGGFSADGREYVIYLESGKTTPSPWINVIANPDFGFLVSETGGGYSWQGNSSENRLTVWRNDPVSDTPSEAVYLRDEETAEIWTPTPLPTGAPEPYLIRHGAGYSIIEHHSHGLKQQMSQFVAPDDPVKIVRLRLENSWERVRRITITYYAEWVLGTVRDVTQQYIIPEFDADSQTLLVHNPYSMEFGEHVTFITASQQFHGLTADRTEFLGRLGSYARPAALGRVGMSGTVRAGLDPCAAIQLHIDLQPGESEEVFFLIGTGPNRETALQLVRAYQNADQVEAAWSAITAFWDRTLSTITTKTPDPAFDLIIRWTLYQALSCRIWGRSALYQSSGAFGFRDQLQDVMGLIYSHPDLLREHILRAARHQFDAGDVLHWWHPPSGRGVRTRFSDDLLWLPLVVAFYVEATGDWDLLAEEMSFLRGEPLNPEEDERYGFYESTAEVHSIYEHCRRALERGTTTGRHGLPLMGSGDWNDGMNRVGIGGQGESVWMGWFLYTVMARFIPLVEHLGDTAQADVYHKRMDDLKTAIETHAWDGDWYLRAFYDDGTPLGSSQSDECQIDAIAQSWGVISGAANPERIQQAMQSVVDQLVREDDQLLLLFTPPFDKTAHDPGYIKGYPPGIRENGGQYTHAAIWTVWAFAMMGDGDRAGALFRLLNPIYHADSRDKAEHYQVEPYVVAADVYSVPPHTGHGGWTWYTGSSGWMHRLGVEAILGLRRVGKDKLRIDPSIPRDWPGFEITYRYGATEYRIQVENPDRISRGVRQVTLDSAVLDGTDIPLRDDGQPHTVIVQMG